MNAAHAAGSDRGFALPAVLLVLIGLGLLLAASSHAARLDLMSSRSLAGAIRAFQGAEAGLALLDAGEWPDPDLLGDVRVRLETTVDTLWRSADGTLLVRARVTALAHDPAGRRAAVRTLETLYLRPSGAPSRRIPGAWREIVRQDS
jgi:hypothetical protein